MKRTQWLRILGLSGLLAWALSHSSLLGEIRAGEPTGLPTPAERIRRTLDATIALEYVGQSFHEAIAHIQERTHLPIVCDRMALQMAGIVEGQPTNVVLKNARGKVRAALGAFLLEHGLTFVVANDTVLVTSEANAVGFFWRQRFPLSAKDVPASQAMREAAKRAGVGLVVDPRVANAASAKVTLELEDATVETAVRLLAEFVDVKAVRLGNVLFVTDAKRAAVIRSEEESATRTLQGPGMAALFGGGFGPGLGGVAAGFAPPGVAPPAIQVEVAPAAPEPAPKR